MRFMHNTHEPYASRETTPGRFESPDHVCRDCRGKKRYGGGFPATVEPACRKSGTAASSRNVSGCPSGPLAAWFRTHLTRPQDPPRARKLATKNGQSRCAEFVRSNAREESLPHFRP